MFLLPLSMSSLFGQDFYDINKIQEIKLYFTQSNWNSLLVTAAASTTEPYTFCQKVIINGVTFDSVGAKYKGNSSFNATRVKNPWHIELDNVKSQNYQGYKDIKLSNIFSDPSCVREALSYELMQPYTNLPRANYAKVWVNDVLIGLYTNTEAITKSFCKDHFPSSNNNIFVKGTPPALNGGSGGASSLAYLGTDSSLYYKSYEVYSDYGWKQLIHLADTLNNKTADVEKILDVDHTLWMLAFNILFVNLDSYTGNFTQNYYLWRDDNGRFIPIIWDLNMSFGGFPGGTGAGGTLDSLGMAKLSPFLHETNAAKPLISKLLTNDRFRKMYIAHLRTMNNEAFKTGKYRTRGEAMRTIIDAAVQGDPNNLSTYALFKTNFYYASTGGQGGPPGGGGGGTPGIVSLVENKIKYLDTLAVMKAIPPVISNITSTPNVRLNDSVWVTAKVTGHTTNGVLIGYRLKNSQNFTRVTMFDDGLHKDGAANDGVFGYGFKLANSSIEYYIWAENANAGIFSPERAEHEYHSVNASLVASDIVINEFMASNISTVKDEFNQYDDWVELYNKGTQAVNIGGYYITDNPSNLTKWTFPANTTIPAGGYLIVWADEDSSQNSAGKYHANFKLSKSGEYLAILNNTGQLLDSLTFGAQIDDRSFSRIPNGTGNFVIKGSTFGKNNESPNATGDLENVGKIILAPNPTTGTLNISTDGDPLSNLSVLNSIGQLMKAVKGIDSQEYILDLSDLSNGFYFIKIGKNTVKKVIVQR